MKRIRTIIGMCILSILSTSGIAATVPTGYPYDSNDPIQNVAREVYDPSQAVIGNIQSMMSQNNVPGMAVALYVNGRPYLYHFGVANKMTMQPVTGNTIFELGSITKTFTSLLLSMEIEAGRMHLHDSVAKYASALQSLGGAVNSITLEQLATHTSSLPYELPDYYISSEQTFTRFLNHWRPYRPIGSTWQYSNIGFGLLGYMLQGATDQSYDQLLHERILNPLGMDHTDIDVPPELESDYAQGYNWSGAPAKQWRHNDAIPAEGAIKSTSEDMLKYLLASLGVAGTPSDIITGSHVACSTYVATRYGLQGLAWEKHPLNTLNNLGYINATRVLFIRDSKVSAVSPDAANLQSADMLIDKTGTTAGFTSYIALIPGQKIGIVLLANRAALRQQIGVTGRKILLSLMQSQPPVFAAANGGAQPAVNTNANNNSNINLAANGNGNGVGNTTLNSNFTNNGPASVNTNANPALNKNIPVTPTVNAPPANTPATDSNIAAALAADANGNHANASAPRVVVTANPNDASVYAQNNVQVDTPHNIVSDTQSVNIHQQATAVVDKTQSSAAINPIAHSNNILHTVVHPHIPINIVDKPTVTDSHEKSSHANTNHRYIARQRKSVQKRTVTKTKAIKKSVKSKTKMVTKTKKTTYKRGVKKSTVTHSRINQSTHNKSNTQSAPVMANAAAANNNGLPNSPVNPGPPKVVPMAPAVQ